ncbi:MAG TPA: ATP-binding protein [Ktedonobacteraceae bacterium]
MTVEAKLCELALQAQNLLLCDGACIIPGCADQALAHALLARWSHYHAPEAAFSPLTSPDFYRSAANEHVKALCDIALETGTTWSIECFPFYHQSGSVVARPLVLPVGRLGVLLIFYLRPSAFRPGDHALLEQYSAYLAQQLEHIAADDVPCERSVVPPVQRTFASVMGHELRAPLAIIKGYASLLRSYDGSEEQQMAPIPIQLRQRYLDAIIEQTDYMTVLVQDMLSVSRLQRGELKFHPTKIDLGRLCKRVVEQMQARTDQQQPGMYQIRCHLDTAIPVLQIDPVRIRQILVNLLENAIKYSPGGGAIEVRVSMHLPSGAQSDATAGEVCITVRDWGVGVPQQQQEMVFRPFVRLEHPLTRYVPGHGLGLSVSRYLAEAMGGSLSLTSDDRHQGTCVILTVPLTSGSEPSTTCEIQHSSL